ncbi:MULTISPECIES: tail fiber assembly protein [unclassified Pseudomonas]|jgi:hypothetical protein|uniref:tail fiber assembly protein n=1 Tax=Pseudomonas TaxID=286 RepID=UPI001304B2CF|nr:MULTISPECIES: tail fiber assembly protein [unclassified Pseudomonas]MBL1311289.1 tail fiber assembly protein [Pseudomonas sp.]
MNDTYLYFTNPIDGLVYAYDESQIAMGYGADMVPLVGAALEAHLHPVPTHEQVVMRNGNEQLARTDEASRVMAPILVSLQLGDATDEEALIAKAWQAYYRALKAVDLTVTNPVWPEKPAS